MAKDHIQPQAYLKRFSSHESKGKRLYEYDMKTNESRHKSLEDAACERNFYSIALLDGRYITDVDDNIIKNIENKAGTIIDTLLLNGVLDNEKKKNLASYIALMLVRTKSFREDYARLFVASAQSKMYRRALDENDFLSEIEKIEHQQGQKFSLDDKNKLKELFLNPKSYQISLQRDFTLSALGAHDIVVPILFQMSWTILHAPKSSFFITSDTPVIKIITKNYQPKDEGLYDKNIQILLTLSPEYCWLGHWDSNLGKQCFIKPSDVRAINRLYATHAERFLYAHKKNEGIELLAKKYSSVRPPKVVPSGAGPKHYSKVTVRRRY